MGDKKVQIRGRVKGWLNGALWVANIAVKKRKDKMVFAAKTWYITVVVKRFAEKHLLSCNGYAIADYDEVESSRDQQRD